MFGKLFLITEQSTVNQWALGFEFWLEHLEKFEINYFDASLQLEMIKFGKRTIKNERSIGDIKRNNFFIATP